MNVILKVEYIILLFAYIILSQIQLSAQVSDQLKENDFCVSCHIESELLPENFREDDIHLQQGLSCSGCHGGDSKEEDGDLAMSKENGFIGIPDKKNIPEFCGKCHSKIDFMRAYRPQIATDQVSQFYTSIHGQKLKEGDNKVADCSSCHTSHSIYPVKDARSSVYATNIPNTCNHCHGDTEYMKEYNIPTNQYAKYSKSVHGTALLDNKDIGAPACNDCHGNHGARPPEIESISHICGSCHINNMEYFIESDMAKSFTQLDYHACEQCHGYHDIQKTTIDFIGIGPKSFCIECHSDSDEGYTTGKIIKEALDQFVFLYDSAKVRFKEVVVKGMNDIEIDYVLQEANHKLIESRTAVHSFNYDFLKEKTDKGKDLARKALSLADIEMDEYYNRRVGFVYSSIALVILGIALFLRIRIKSKTAE